MRESLDGLLRETTLVTLALAVALGWSLFQVAEGLATAVTTLLADYPNVGGRTVDPGFPLTWEVSGRILTLGPLVQGLIELAVVLLVALLIYRARPSVIRR